MKSLLVSLTIVACLVLAGCPKIEQDARDTAAALGGAITAAQAQHQECKTAPTGSACLTINKAVDGQNALVTSIEAYCGWTAGVLPTDPNTKCVPVQSASTGLQTAINNANTFISQLKGVIQ